MGGDRAGFHSWDRMDRHGEPSADRIVPERQHLQQRQRRNAEPSGQNWMITEVVEPGRTLGAAVGDRVALRPFLRSAGRPAAPGLPGRDLGLLPVAGSRRQTRLVARTRGRSRPQPLMGAAGLVLLQPLHVIMQTASSATCAPAHKRVRL